MVVSGPVASCEVITVSSGKIACGGGVASIGLGSAVHGPSIVSGCSSWGSIAGCDAPATGVLDASADADGAGAGSLSPPEEQPARITARRLAVTVRRRYRPVRPFEAVTRRAYASRD